jgi:Holliday junction resolvase
MAHPSKRKGNRYERELVEAAKEAGLTAERAYASNGRSLGEAEAVDVLIRTPDGTPWRVQAKRRKAVAQYLTPPDGADVTMVRADYADTLVVVPLDLFFDLLDDATE